MAVSPFKGALLVLKKELRVAFRSRSSLLTMLMFSLTSLLCVSFLIKGEKLSPELYAALLWVVLFFSSVTGAGRVFAEEAEGGTLLALRVYGSAQAVLWGKMLYTLFLLLLIGVVTLPLFVILLDVSVISPLLLAAAVVLGLLGIAAAGTIVGALTIGASVQGGLFSVLMLPVLLPVLLMAGAVSGAAMGGGGSASLLLALLLYDAVLALGASVLFDYLWYEV